MSKEKRRDQRRNPDPLTIDIAGPCREMRQPGSTHLLSFKQGSYYNSVPLSTEELKATREAITNWLGDGYELLHELAERYGYRLASMTEYPFEV